MQSRVAFAEPADLTHPVLIQRIDLLQLQRLRSPNHPVTRSNHINPRRTHVTPEVMLNRSHDAEQILSRNDVEHTPSLNEHTDENEPRRTGPEIRSQRDSQRPDSLDSPTMGTARGLVGDL